MTFQHGVARARVICAYTRNSYQDFLVLISALSLARDWKEGGGIDSDCVCVCVSITAAILTRAK